MKKIKEEKNYTKKKNNKILALVVIAVIIAGIAYAVYRSDETPSASLAAVVDGIQCNANEYVAQHIHAHLDIFVNDKLYLIPQGIGIKDNTCLYWLHTHTANGVIHIESPTQQQFMLSQFIDVWKSSGDFPISGAMPMIFVNGQLVNSTIDNTKINKHDEIVLVYGNTPPVVPSFYQFDQGE